MLTLTITDPHKLTEAEKNAVLAFAQITGIPRPALVIEPADRPDVGLEIPRVTEAKFAAPVAPRSEPAGLTAVGLDPAKVFGGQVPSVPLPPATAATGGSDGTSAVPVPPVPPSPPGASPETAHVPPSAPAATAGGPPAGVDTDSRGLPWDDRIHASTKGKNADGAWKKKKNLQPEVQVAVEAELRALMGITVAKPLTLPAGAVAVEPGSTPTTFPQLMGWITRLVADKKLTQADVTGIVAPIGMASVVGLNNRPDLIPQVHAEIVAKVAANEAGAA